MQKDEPIDTVDADLIDSLRGLELARPSTSERAIWFAAGREAGRRQSRRWRLISIGTVLIAAGVIAHDMHPTSQDLTVKTVATKSISVPQIVKPNEQDRSEAALKASAYELALLDAVAENGLRGLPKASANGFLADSMPGFSNESDGPRMRHLDIHTWGEQ